MSAGKTNEEPGEWEMKQVAVSECLVVAEASLTTTTQKAEQI